jgi:5-formyltetrahydrofolate cyclo-ligase
MNEKVPFEPTEVQLRQFRRLIERQRLDQMDRAQSDDERNRNRGRSSLIGLLPFHKVFKCVHCGKEVDTLDTVTADGCNHL